MRLYGDVMILYKNILIKIKKSFGRFASLLIIVALGSGFYAGISSTAPNVTYISDQYFSEHNLMDFKIVGTMGLTENDVTAVRELAGVGDVIGSYSLDVISEGKAVRIHALENGINRVTLISGRMPSAHNECVADARVYGLGDTVIIESDTGDKLNNNQFTVVGTIDSVLYLGEDYGTSIAGGGKLYSFLFIDSENFNLDAYTEIYITASAVRSEKAYSDGYDKLAESLYNELTSIKAGREDARFDELFGELLDNPYVNINPDELGKSVWYIYDRNSIGGYDNLKSGIKIVDSVASVFPLFFIIIVILISSNTMVRMIIEERGEMGSLASIGYGNGAIIASYLFYVLLATVSGEVAGFFVGSYIIPPLIYTNFGAILPPLVIKYDMVMFVLTLLVTVTVMSGVTVFSCRNHLKNMPASLLRPVPPGKGKNVMIERIKPLWNRLSFIWKITVRNISRYKKRAVMTVIGVAGCTAILLAGFGVRDSMNAVAQKQYGDIFRYDTMIILKEETKEIGQDLQNMIDEHGIKFPMTLRQSAVKCHTDAGILDAIIVVPENEQDFQKYYNLYGNDGEEKIKLREGGVVLTHKLAEILDIKRGDQITVKDTDNRICVAEVLDIAQNYVSNYVYMLRGTYEEEFGVEVKFNAVVSELSGDTSGISESLIKSELILGVYLSSDMTDGVAEMTQRLDGVIVLLVATGSLLALVVLYNLTSINISERTREISTLKVLGFFDRETGEYIYREAAILTVISVCVGLVLGMGLHGYVIEATGASAVVFPREIKPLSFVFSASITFFFSMIMQVVTLFKLKTIDMTASLKSVE